MLNLLLSAKPTELHLDARAVIKVGWAPQHRPLKNCEKPRHSLIVINLLILKTDMKQRNWKNSLLDP